jgi:anhydro-N-acetylmuramic acid kinase
MVGTRLIAGAMSGTSADGVDVAITRIEGTGHDVSACLVLHHFRPFATSLTERIVAARSGEPIRLAELADLARHVSLVYAAAINEALIGAHLSCGDLAAIAAHGQTLFHAPPMTIQWLDPSLLAAEVGCKVISDFRRADCAAGGQGAPLVPYADFVLFRHREKSRVLVNIGGIANLTYLPAGANMEWVAAFDTGPGNCVSDWLMRRFEPDGLGVDLGGERALRGKVIRPVVDRMLKQRWFWARPPKSTDGPDMVEMFRESFEGALGDHKLDNLLATACCITAYGITSAMERFIKGDVDEVIVSGGGTRNAAIMKFIQDDIGEIPLLTTDDLGVKSDAKEAIAFALLGAATLDEIASNVPSATGARRGVVLGSVTPRP